jgi:hypothetical protein
MALDIRPALQPFIEAGLDVSVTHIVSHSLIRLSPWYGLSEVPPPLPMKA